MVHKKKAKYRFMFVNIKGLPVYVRKGSAYIYEKEKGKYYKTDEKW